MSTRTVHLTDHFQRFIEDGITSGRFADANEAVSEGLRLLEQRECEDDAKLQWLQSAIDEGFDEIDRGDAIAFATMDKLGTHLERLAADVAAEYTVERKHG